MPEKTRIKEDKTMEKGMRNLRCNDCFSKKIVSEFPSNLIVLDKNSMAVSVSRRLCEKFDVPPEEIIGRNIAKIFDTIGISKEYIDLFLSGKNPEQYICDSPKKGKMILNITLRNIILGENSLEKTFLVIDDITKHKKIEEISDHLAYYNLLTDLPNRIMLHIYLDKAIIAAKDSHKSFALLLIDIDRFREINDTLGHHNGDLILKEIGACLKATVKKTDIVTHLSGDEFAVLLPDSDMDGAIKTANSIIKRLEELFFIEEVPVQISASIGISLYPGHGEDYHALMMHADIAMYKAKKTWAGYCLYSPEYNHYSPEKLSLVSELRHAINSGQLFLYYQPKIDLKTRTVIGVEALVRWQHPRLGIIPPDRFMPLAEHTGLIKELTVWIIREGLRQSHSWNKSGLEIPISVNISARNLQDHAIPQKIMGFLSTWGGAASPFKA
ncbi:MAG TPA: diguanylate cyclase [Candidatus Brocadiales bacterium]|nr:diguanylate cyclase [Candidatus Brocadiales bacterium]